MTRVSILRFVADDWQSVSPVSGTELLDALDRADASGNTTELRGVPYQWDPRKGRLPRGDLLTASPPCAPVMSDRARDVLSAALGDQAEFFQVRLDENGDRAWMLRVPRRLNALAAEKSGISRNAEDAGGAVSRIGTPCFDEAVLRGVYLFRLSIAPTFPVMWTDAGVEAVANARLTAFEFLEVYPHSRSVSAGGVLDLGALARSARRREKKK